MLVAAGCKSDGDTPNTDGGALDASMSAADGGDRDGSTQTDADSGNVRGDAGQMDDEDAGAIDEADSSVTAADASQDAGTDVCATAALCDGFEDGTGFDTSVWTPVIEWGNESNAGLARVTTDKAHSGKRSAHFQLYAGTNQAVSAFIKQTTTSGDLDEHMFGRMYMFADISGARGHMWYVWAGDPAASRALEVGQGGISGNWQLTAWGTPEYPSGSASGIPQGTWACLEWEMTKSTGQISVWIDGDQVATLSNANAANWCSFEEVRIGLHQYGNANAPTVANLYVDDLVLADTRIGCD